MRQRAGAMRSALASFLPTIAAANQALERRIASEGREAVNVEVVPEGQAQYIQMVRGGGGGTLDGR